MSDSLLPFQPSLASATNTRLETAARHNQQCRVSTDDMLMYVGHDQEELQRQKYRYCIHKDEFVVGIGRPWKPNASRKRTNNAYPRVISNLGAWNPAVDPGPDLIKYMFHFARSLAEKKHIVRWFSDGGAPRPPRVHTSATVNHQPPPQNWFFKDAKEADASKHVVSMLSDQISVGFANTLGWAHPNTGDTMVTVNIGGLRTVMNGDFEIFTGDLIQWYWPFEKDCFKPGGDRKPYPAAWETADDVVYPPNLHPEYDPITRSEDGKVNLDHQAAAREGFYSREFDSRGLSAKRENLKLVARIKPYIRDDDNPRIFDAQRVFGVAIACARPHEMVDIKISRQSV